MHVDGLLRSDIRPTRPRPRLPPVAEDRAGETARRSLGGRRRARRTVASSGSARGPGRRAARRDPPEAARARVRSTFAADGSGAARPRPASGCLFGAVCHLLRRARPTRPMSGGRQALTLTPAFAWNRSCYDIFLTQEARVQRGLDPGDLRPPPRRVGLHPRRGERAWPTRWGSRPGRRARCTRCSTPTARRSISSSYSSLNKGLYPFYYLSANLDRLKRNAALARKYGLVPGLLCFEPRSVPEEFFARYPMLRGPRVDHPFRSFKPRYTMTLDAPARARALRGDDPDAAGRGSRPRLPRRLDATTAARASSTRSRSTSAATAAPT